MTGHLQPKTHKSGGYLVQHNPELIKLVIAERRRLCIGEGFNTDLRKPS